MDTITEKMSQFVAQQQPDITKKNNPYFEKEGNAPTRFNYRENLTLFEKSWKLFIDNPKNKNLYHSDFIRDLQQDKQYNSLRYSFENALKTDNHPHRRSEKIHENTHYAEWRKTIKMLLGDGHQFIELKALATLLESTKAHNMTEFLQRYCTQTQPKIVENQELKDKELKQLFDELLNVVFLKNKDIYFYKPNQFELDKIDEEKINTHKEYARYCFAKAANLEGSPNKQKDKVTYTRWRVVITEILSPEHKTPKDVKKLFSILDTTKKEDLKTKLNNFLNVLNEKTQEKTQIGQTLKM